VAVANALQPEAADVAPSFCGVLANFLLRMRTNCYFPASDQNSVKMHAPQGDTPPQSPSLSATSAPRFSRLRRSASVPQCKTLATSMREKMPTKCLLEHTQSHSDLDLWPRYVIFVLSDVVAVSTSSRPRLSCWSQHPSLGKWGSRSRLGLEL